MFISAHQRRASFALAAFCGLWVLVAVARPLIRAGDGLTAQYFPNSARAGSPTRSAIDHVPSTAAVTARWHDAPPASFSVIWTGYAVAPSSGRYTFATRSDDGSRLFVDDQLIVDNSGAHGPQTREGRVALLRGEHRVRLEYVQLGAGYEIAWLWGRGDSALTTVPGWALSVRPASPAAVIAARGADGALNVFGVLAAIAGVWLVIVVAVDPRASEAARGVLGRPRYRGTSAAAMAAAVWIALLATPWPGGGPPLFVTAVSARVRDLNLIAAAGLRHFTALQRHLGTPRAGEDVLPERVLAMVAMLDAQHVRHYQLSETIAADAWVLQQMVATAWPRTLEPGARERFLLESEHVPPECRLIDREKDVLLVTCP